MSAGKLRKLWDSLSELRSSLCEILERTVLRPALLPVKTAQFTQFFPSGMTSHSKIAVSLSVYSALNVEFPHPGSLSLRHESWHRRGGKVPSKISVLNRDD